MTALQAFAASPAFFSQRFNDLHVGDTFVTQGRTLTETDVVQFAHMTGDTLPVHTDRHWAAEHGLYGQRTANGLLVVSYTVGLLPLDHHQVVALRRVRNLTFKRPAFLGDTIRGIGQIERLMELGPFGCVVCSIKTVNQDNALVVHGVFEMLWNLGADDEPEGEAR
jgi:3-hydroxybutyryl-CoA dehydratase